MTVRSGAAQDRCGSRAAGHSLARFKAPVNLHQTAVGQFEMFDTVTWIVDNLYAEQSEAIEIIYENQAKFILHGPMRTFVCGRYVCGCWVV